jgi:molecular chaperone DnaJ
MSIGEGDAGQRGGPPGDLYVFLAVEADKQFRREGIDLYTDLDVDYLGESCCDMVSWGLGV